MSLMNSKRGAVSALALLCTATFVTSGAMAAAPETVDSVNVGYVAADLGKPDGAGILYRRIQLAAQTVCHEPDIRNLTALARYQKCFESAVDAAVARVNASALTALHRSKTQRNAAG